MLKSNQIEDDFASISVSKEYDGQPYYWTTFFYYKGLVIDTGCPHAAEESLDFFKQRGWNVEAVLLTHSHEDHCGAACLFKEILNVDVFAPKKSVEILLNPPEIPVYRQHVWGQPKPVAAKLVEENMRIQDLAIRTVDTPGHSFDDVSFLVDRKLFLGDLVTNLKPVIAKNTEDYIDLIESLRKVTGLDFQKAYGGHGTWNKKALEANFHYILQLKKEVEQLCESGLSSEKIVEKMFPNVSDRVTWIEKMSKHDWSRKNLVESLLGMRHKNHEP